MIKQRLVHVYVYACVKTRQSESWPKIKFTVSGEMRKLWYFLLISITFETVTGQAPGDENVSCLTRITRQSFANQILLMSSHNYINLIEDDGPWIVRNEDDNNDGRTLTSETTVGDEISMEFSMYKFCYSGSSQDQIVRELLMCADLRLGHKITG